MLAKVLGVGETHVKAYEDPQGSSGLIISGNFQCLEAYEMKLKALPAYARRW